MATIKRYMVHLAVEYEDDEYSQDSFIIPMDTARSVDDLMTSLRVRAQEQSLLNEEMLEARLYAWNGPHLHRHDKLDDVVSQGEQVFAVAMANTDDAEADGENGDHVQVDGGNVGNETASQEGPPLYSPHPPPPYREHVTHPEDEEYDREDDYEMWLERHEQAEDDRYELDILCREVQKGIDQMKTQNLTLAYFFCDYLREIFEGDDSPKYEELLELSWLFQRIESGVLAVPAMRGQELFTYLKENFIREHDLHGACYDLFE
ncbi:hypothetical protein NA57DRAFT_61345 [Rhizodiscina lignyota]|uniref:Uncharacterized protein n=1 Tax=Rhizodiscina lignyota TaxID=1504668 RepID=A0A9P4M5A2_9PEZI|nr:hypothetical protein NA57DRAFT_61345 [Rhizodiscina lignyota]